MLFLFGISPNTKYTYAVFGLVLKTGSLDVLNMRAYLVACKNQQLDMRYVPKLIEEYNLPLVPKLFGSLVNAYASAGFTYEDRDSVTELHAFLEKRGVVYTLHEPLHKALKLLVTLEFGPKNMVVVKKARADLSSPSSFDEMIHQNLK
ncbi:unnamed protein product [Cochlearia groenlandica]